MKLKCSFEVIDMGGELIAVPVGDEAASFNGVVALSYAAAFLLKELKKPKSEKELIDSSYTIPADVLKTGHHGKSDATNKKFLKAVQPKYAVICCGRTEDGEEGTPATKVLDLLSDFHVITYRTDLNGTVVFKTDGTTLTCNCDTEQQ